MSNTSITRSLTCLAAAVATMSISESAMSAGTTTHFAFNDERYLQKGEQSGGAVFVPAGERDEPRPIVVFLHGTNDYGPVHRWMGGAGIDLRPVFDELVGKKRIVPAVLAAPSQTRDAATGSRLWDGFDLEAFVTATAAAVPGVTIDRSRIVLVGHSGAGCNATGGLLGARAKGLVARVAIDSCMDAKFGELYGRAADQAPIHVFWQPAIWPRPFDEFEAAFKKELGAVEGRVGTVTRLSIAGDDPHNVIVSTALARVLPELLAPPADST